MKVVGGTIRHKKGFSEELNRFFQLIAEFRRDSIFVPKGIFRFETFEEAEQWRHKMLRGKRPGRRQ